MNVADPDEWEREYKELFFGDPLQFELRREREKRVKPAVPGEQATWAIRRPEGAQGAAAAAGVRIHGAKRPDGPPDGDVAAPSGPSFTVGDDGELSLS